MRLPRGMSVGGKTLGGLHKSLYGLKQIAHVWHSLSEKWLLAHDKRLRKSAVDPCLFVILDRELKVVISTHVDDYIVASNNTEWITDFKSEFSQAFNISHLGRAEHVLQMAINWKEDSSVKISQKRFITELVDEYSLTDAKPVQTPMERDLQLKPAETPDTSLPCRSIIGSLQWIQRGFNVCAIIKKVVAVAACSRMMRRPGLFYILSGVLLYIYIYICVLIIITLSYDNMIF